MSSVGQGSCDTQESLGPGPPPGTHVFFSTLLTRDSRPHPSRIFSSPRRVVSPKSGISWKMTLPWGFGGLRRSPWNETPCIYPLPRYLIFETYTSSRSPITDIIVFGCLLGRCGCSFPDHYGECRVARLFGRLLPPSHVDN